ncbi:hypothetical protein T484DRAFT_1918835, partial [Baffinella frigidus]
MGGRFPRPCLATSASSSTGTLAALILAAILSVATASCPSGYEDELGVCTDIDECQLGTTNCHVMGYCKNTAGAYTCQCPRGILVRTIVTFAGVDLTTSWPEFENTVAKVYASQLHTGHGP